MSAMQAFQDLVPSQLRTTIIPRSWADVETAVTEVQQQWGAKNKESYFGKATLWVRKMCNGMHNHSMALKMLPAESEYVSLFAGAVSMIIKVIPRGHPNGP